MEEVWEEEEITGHWHLYRRVHKTFCTNMQGEVPAKAFKNTPLMIIIYQQIGKNILARKVYAT